MQSEPNNQALYDCYFRDSFGLISWEGGGGAIVEAVPH